MFSPAEITPQTIDELSPALLRSARRLSRGRAEAEDLVQETWLSALRGATQFEGRSSLRTWLNGIMRRRAADQYRHARRACELSEHHDAGDMPALVEWLDNVSHAALARSALSELSLLEQAAIRLCDLEDCDRDEAAARMGITRGHLRVLLHRGRQKLALRLAQQGIRGLDASDAPTVVAPVQHSPDGRQT